MKICSIDGCNGEAKGKGMCWKHYARSRRQGNTDDPNYINSGKTCFLKDCNGKAIAEGMCRKHRYRLLEHGNPHELVRTKTIKGDICLVTGCEDTVRSSVFCNKHYCNYHYHLKRKNISTIPEYLELVKQRNR
jgi:hypothetical protein